MALEMMQTHLCYIAELNAESMRGICRVEVCKTSLKVGPSPRLTPPHLWRPVSLAVDGQRGGASADKDPAATQF